jgi:hypothetical protein
MAHVLIENGTPVCRLSRRALLGLGEKPDPKRLYLLQLLEWTFSAGEIRDRNGEIRDTLHDMRHWKPRKVLDFLSGANSGHPMPLPHENLTPRELAYYLLLLLQASVAEHQSGVFPLQE